MKYQQQKQNCEIGRYKAFTIHKGEKIEAIFREQTL